MKASGFALRLSWVGLLLNAFGCGAINPTGSLDYQPSQLAIGQLVIGTWLPAGLNEFRFDAADRELLAGLGLNYIEWVQRHDGELGTAEEQLMVFASERGMQMPVYYEPRGFTPYDKLRNWATRAKIPAVDDSLSALVAELRDQWSGVSAFSGYLIGHEDYRAVYYPALASLVGALQAADPGRPALSVGRLQDYEAPQDFFAALFDAGGTANIFQQEHYIFRGEVPRKGRLLQRRLGDLIAGYDGVARGLEGRSGRWHAIIQVQSEVRAGKVYYRKPEAAEIELQVGLALSRGASGIVYFLYSSGVEELRDGAGDLVETRVYEGLVDIDGAPTASYRAVRRLNGDLKRLSTALQDLHFHGALSTEFLLGNDLLLDADEDLEFGLFGDGSKASHLLVVNRQTHGGRHVRLRLMADDVVDAVAGEALAVENGRVTLELAAGASRLLHVVQRSE